jgi:hypothetical protein
MRTIALALLFSIIGVAVGYGIWGRVGDRYVDPARLWQPERQGVSRLIQGAADKLERIEERRQNILLSGAIGAIVGGFLGTLTTTRPRKGAPDASGAGVHKQR